MILRWNYSSSLSFWFLLVLLIPSVPCHQSSPPSSHSISSSSSTDHNSKKDEDKRSFFWRINSVPPAYMFGTIHVPYTRVWGAVPDNAKMAFYNSRQVFFELDLADHGTMSALATCRILPPSQHLSQLIPSELYFRIRLHLERVKEAMPDWITQDQKERGFDADYLFSAVTANWERNKPIWVLLMISTLTKSDIASRGTPVLDLFLSSLAKKHQKRISAIEQVEEQCRPLNALPLDKVIFALNHTLQYQESTLLGLGNAGRRTQPGGKVNRHYSTEDLIRQYRAGNFDNGFYQQDTFQMYMVSSGENGDQENVTEKDKKMFKEIDRYFQKELIEARNRRMAARMIDLLVNRPDSYFFAFGAGHFLGENSILDYLEQAGFSIDQIGPEEYVDFRHSSPRRKTLVQGTFDDLPEDEKNRAMLQFLQYHQQLEKSSETAKFEDLVWAGSVPTTTTESADKYVQDDLDEKAVEESLKVWYGLNRRNNIVNFENMPSTGSRLGKLPSIMLLASMWTTLAGKMYKI